MPERIPQMPRGQGVGSTPKKALTNLLYQP